MANRESFEARVATVPSHRHGRYRYFRAGVEA